MTDQTPITRGDLRRLFLRLQAPGNESLVEKFDAWCAAEPSASPPRVPGASAHPVREGVESGPGQPMTDAMAQRLREISGLFMPGTALEIDLSAGAMLIDALDAEIRRLREQITALKFSLDLARDCDKEAAQLIAEGRRAGIEEAAQIAIAEQQPNAIQDSIGSAVHNAATRIEHGIRALADKPAPDPRLPGLQYVRREWFKIRTTGATLAEWLDAQIAACTAKKGGDNG